MRVARFLARAGAATIAVGVTAGGSPAASQRLHAEPVARGFQQPLYAAFDRAAPGTMYVVQKNGLVLAVEQGRIQPEPFLDLRSVVGTRGEGGLLSIAFRERGGARYVYADYGRIDRTIEIVRYPVQADSADVRRGTLLLRIPPGPTPFHFGGQLAFGPGGGLYVSAGDGGYLLPHDRAPGCGPLGPCSVDPHGNAQNLASLRGKLLRIPPGGGRATPTVVAYGLRNPWRFSFDRATGDLWVADVGWKTKEEIDYLPASFRGLANFGWSVFEGDVRRDGGAPSVNAAGRLVAPVLTYGHESGDCSITGGYVYRGRDVPSLRGRYVYGDYCSGRIWSLRLVAGQASDVRLEAAHVPALASFGEDLDGELYAVSLDGTVFRID